MEVKAILIVSAASSYSIDVTLSWRGRKKRKRGREIHSSDISRREKNARGKHEKSWFRCSVQSCRFLRDNFKTKSSNFHISLPDYVTLDVTEPHFPPLPESSSPLSLFVFGAIFHGYFHLVERRDRESGRERERRREKCRQNKARWEETGAREKSENYLPSTWLL